MYFNSQIIIYLVNLNLQFILINSQFFKLIKHFQFSFTYIFLLFWHFLPLKTI